MMVFAGASVAGNGRLHFVDEKASVNADYYVNNFISELVEDATALMPDGFIFQQNGAPTHRACDWLHATCMRCMNGHQTRQILIRLIIMCGVPCWKPTTSWSTKHWRRLGASFGGRGRRISAENFFCPPQEMRNLGGGTTRDSLYLGNKCWLSIIMYIDAVYITIYFTL